MKGSEFVFAYAHSLYYECHKMNPNQSRSNRDSPDWIKNKKAIINPIINAFNRLQQLRLIIKKKTRSAKNNKN